MTRRQEVLQQRARGRQRHKNLQMAGLATGAIALGYSVTQLTNTTWSLHLEAREAIGRKDELVMIACSRLTPMHWQDENWPLPEVPPLLTGRQTGLLQHWPESKRDKVLKDCEAVAAKIVKENFDVAQALAEKLEGGQLAGHTIRSTARNIQPFKNMID